ncbi:MAG: hypothetical protein ACK4J0_03940 [Candidatus Anstonellaceae archaeon]
MEEEQIKEVFKELNLVKLDINYNKTLEENVSNFLIFVYGFPQSEASKLSKKIIKNALVILTPNGEIEKKVSKNGIEKGSKVFISEKFLEPEIIKLKKSKAQTLEPIDLNKTTNEKEQKHLEDFLKEQIETILKTFFDVIEKDKKSEYKIVQSYAQEIDRKIKNIIETNKELSENEINEIVAYLNGRAAYYQTLENAKMFAKIDLKSKNKFLFETAKAVLETIDKKDIGIEQLQGINFYVMQRSRYDYIVENCFLYAEKELREEKDQQKIKQAREILNILSKDEQSPEEVMKLNAYLNQKELEGSIKIINDVLQNETNEMTKNYIQNVLGRLKENQPLTLLDFSALRSYYQDRIKDIIMVDGLKLLQSRKDEWAKTTAEKLQTRGLSAYEVQEIYWLVKNSAKLEQKEKELRGEKVIEGSKKEEVLSLIEILTHKANEIQDEKKIDQILFAIEEAEEKLPKIEKISSKKLQEKEYGELISTLKKFLT